jgi:hypothetical protein
MRQSRRKLSILVTTLSLLAGCETHPPVCTVPCKACREVAVMVLREQRPDRTMGGVPRTIGRYTCVTCGPDVEIFEQNGILMLRCPRCAPTGVECASCVGVDPETPGEGH